MSVVLCSGTDKGSRGTAYVVYEDIYDAKQALEHLGGFNVQNRYLILQVG
jgi:pre-mRNA branch site protein p14